MPRLGVLFWHLHYSHISSCSVWVRNSSDCNWDKWVRKLGCWNLSSLGGPLVPWLADAETLYLLGQFNPARIESVIQTLVDFGTLHTASTSTNPTKGIGAARVWLLQQMAELAKPSNGPMVASMPCYNQTAVPPSIPFDI
jgi:hypothetical protein